jgi:hypothetical protein
MHLLLRKESLRCVPIYLKSIKSATTKTHQAMVSIFSLYLFFSHTHKIIRTPRNLWALGPPPRVRAGSQENTPRKRQTQDEAEEDQSASV